MTTDAIGFYLSHRDQITQWAKLEGRVDALMRDAVNEGNANAAINLLKGTSGDQEADFYVRNQALIREWDDLQIEAGQALHRELLAVGREADYKVKENARHYSSVGYRSPEFDDLGTRYGIRLELVWMKQDLLSTRRGYRYPRLALHVHKDNWEGENRQSLITATRPVAHELGMKERGDWQLHYGMLDPDFESLDPRGYAEQFVAILSDAATRLYPVIEEAIAATHVALQT